MADPKVTGMAVLTTAQRDALIDLQPGLRIFNTDTNTVDYYNGTIWIPLVKTSPENGIVLDTSASNGTLLTSGFYRVQTTDATPFPILSYTMDEESMIQIDSRVFAANIDYSAGFFSDAYCAFRRPLAGNAIRIGPSNGITSSRNDFPLGGPSVLFIENGINLEFQITGMVAQTINWAIYISLFQNFQ